MGHCGRLALALTRRLENQPAVTTQLVAPSLSTLLLHGEVLLARRRPLSFPVLRIDHRRSPSLSPLHAAICGAVCNIVTRIDCRSQHSSHRLFCCPSFSTGIALPALTTPIPPTCLSWADTCCGLCTRHLVSLSPASRLRPSTGTCQMRQGLQPPARVLTS